MSLQTHDSTPTEAVASQRLGKERAGVAKFAAVQNPDVWCADVTSRWP